MTVGEFKLWLEINDISDEAEMRHRDPNFGRERITVPEPERRPDGSVVFS